MNNQLIVLDPIKSIIDLTKKMEEKQKYAFVNISRTAISSLTPSPEKKIPKNFVKAISKCATMDHPNFLKAVPVDYAEELTGGVLNNIGLKNNRKYYDASTFDYFYNTKKEVVNIFIDHYIRDSKNVIVTFHDKKTIQNIFGSNQYIITVPFNSYFDKLDAIQAQVEEFSGGVDHCIMDCPLLSTALAPKIWENLDMSILDLGKVVSASRFSNTRSNEKRS
jgi:hypothetical protein